jgi:hypothetical protein
MRIGPKRLHMANSTMFDVGLGAAIAGCDWRRAPDFSLQATLLDEDGHVSSLQRHLRMAGFRLVISSDEKGGMMESTH